MRERAAAVVIAFTTASALTVLFVRGFFVRWFSDDFAIPACVAQFGFWGAQAEWYRIWSGRFTFNLADALLAVIGPHTAMIVAPLTAIAMVAAMRSSVRHWTLALAMSWAILLGASDVPQSVLWETGLLSYALPLAAFAWWIGNASERTEWRWFDAAVPFIAGGCSETEVLVQIVICATAFAAWRRKPMLAGLLASLLCLAAIAMSPGNAIRKSLVPVPPPIVDVLSATAVDAASFFAHALTRSGLILLVVFLVATLWAPRMPRRLAIVALLCAIGGAAITLAAGEFALAVPLPERARLIDWALVIASVAAAGAALPATKRWTSAIAIATLIAALVPVVSAIQLAREIPEASAFAARWDRLNAFLSRNRGRDVLIYDAPGSVGTLRFLYHDPEKNSPIATIYGLRSLTAMPPYRNGLPVIVPADAVRYRFE